MSAWVRKLNPRTCTCENSKYLVSVIDDSVIMSYEIKEDTETAPTKSGPTKCTLTNFYILLAFLLII